MNLAYRLYYSHEFTSLFVLLAALLFCIEYVIYANDVSIDLIIIREVEFYEYLNSEKIHEL